METKIKDAHLDLLLAVQRLLAEADRVRSARETLLTMAREAPDDDDEGEVVHAR